METTETECLSAEGAEGDSKLFHKDGAFGLQKLRESEFYEAHAWNSKDYEA